MNVTIYSTTNCAFCKTEKQWLDSKGVEYTAINIEEDQEAADYLTEITGATSVPVTVVVTDGHSEIIRGFDRPKLTEVLGL